MRSKFPSLRRRSESHAARSTPKRSSVRFSWSTFANEQGLTAAGGGLYGPTPASGAPIQGFPAKMGGNDRAWLALEASNVNVSEQHGRNDRGTASAYEMGTKTMKVADEM